MLSHTDSIKVTEQQKDFNVTEVCPLWSYFFPEQHLQQSEGWAQEHRPVQTEGGPTFMIDWQTKVWKALTPWARMRRHGHLKDSAIKFNDTLLVFTTILWFLMLQWLLLKRLKKKKNQWFKH